MEKLSEMKEWIGYGLAIIFLGLAVTIFFIYDGRLEEVSIKYSNEGIKSAVEASDNSSSIYEFSKYQLEEGIIDNKGYSDSIGKLVVTHDKLIEMVSTKSITDANDEATAKAIQFLTTRKVAYENLKSAVDMGAENFNMVAENKFTESKQVKQELEQIIISNQK